MTSAQGTPNTDAAVRLVLLGSGELGREVAIEAKRLGCEVVAVDRYAGAPAMQVADRAAVIDMTDPEALRAALAAERARPCARLIVVPEIEAIATPVLEELGLPTSPYRFCASLEEVRAAVAELGAPCVLKPVMSSSGKGQSVVASVDDAARAWDYAQAAGRVAGSTVIVEGFVEFDYEITLLTVRHAGGTSFCAPIGHVQVDGDYRESWQPQPMSETARARAEELAATITGALGGSGIFGVELFVRGDDVLFSEVSPRPHDTGMVTMATQALSEFALHVRAILGLAVPAGAVPLRSPGASAVILAEAAGDAPRYEGLQDALATDPAVDVRIFGKPDARLGRRMGVALAAAGDVDAARERAHAAAGAVRVRTG